MDMSQFDEEQETVPIQVLSKIINPEVLSKVKSHLKTVATGTRSKIKFHIGLLAIGLYNSYSGLET